MLHYYSIFEHPNNNCMTYYKHMKFSLQLAYIMFISSGKAIIHAFIPSVFITSSSDTTIILTKLIQNSGCNYHS